MFRLKKLEIQGFKSFVEKTSLTLPSRITAIVGPNGSGKSNICDAVQWVLGEQSARVLRGATMEDVIFNGSARRKPLGMAEVSLTLGSREENRWTETGGEVVLTRRVVRDGTSDYFLNGKRSRLKDIQDLLLGTGLGVRAYSIIEQQKIDLILSTKPQDRRRLIEEASGISKYKVRKHQAEVKLEETRANLLRITDIVNEIERSCNSLKRQAARAGRWKELADALAKAKRKLLRLRFDRLEEATRQAAQHLETLGGEEAELGAVCEKLDEAFEALRHQAAEAERARREAAASLARARETMISIEAALGRAARQAEEALARGQLIDSQRQQAEFDRSRALEEVAETTQLLATVEEELKQTETAVQQTFVTLTEETRREKEIADRRENARRDLLAAGSRSAEAANRERQAAILADRLTFGLAKFTERKARAAEALEQREATLAEATETEELARARMEEARSTLEEMTVEKKGIDDRIRSLKAEKETVQQRFHGLDRRIASLETTLRERESGGRGAQKALKAAGVRPAGVLADHYEVAEGFEKALDAALGTTLESPVLEDRSALEATLAAIRSGKLGTARFIYPLSERGETGTLSDGRVAGVSYQLLKPRPGSEKYAHSIPDAVVAQTLDDALHLAKTYPLRTIVTRDGIVVKGAAVEAAGSELPDEGLFTVRRDLKDLVKERETLVARQMTLQEEIEATTQVQSELTADLDRQLSVTRRTEREHSESEARKKAAAAERQRAHHECTVLDDEEEIHLADLKAATEKKLEAAQLAAERGSQMADIERLIMELEGQVEAIRARRLTAAEADAAARSKRDLARERRRNLAEALTSQRARADSAARRFADSASARDRLEELRETALREGETCREQLEEARAAVSLAERAKEETEARAEELEQQLETADGQLHSSRQRLDALRKTRFEAELVLERRRADRDHVVETCQTDFSCLPSELPGVSDMEGEIPAEQALAEEVASRTAALEKLGAVNHAALEEYDEESKRLHEMTTQKMDLEESVAQIQETIRTINETSTGRFQEAFAAINGNFARVFQRLFRGGTAAMQLIDENDPLESGIEIIAQPPGKRNQSISLLSGGEKALTAIALLVGIFMYKPSPFCIMDEVDAPLDEANIDRFTALLSEMAEETQFVLITHSKRTMETAQALYGVTQEEPGVSKIVSVRFD